MISSMRSKQGLSGALWQPDTLLLDAFLIYSGIVNTLGNHVKGISTRTPTEELSKGVEGSEYTIEIQLLFEQLDQFL